MPYIKQDARKELDPYLRALINALAEHPSGSYNYAITMLLHAFLAERGLCYETLNSIMGIISCVRDEFYATVVRPYEERKRRENGDINESR